MNATWNNFKTIRNLWDNRKEIKMNSCRGVISMAALTIVLGHALPAFGGPLGEPVLWRFEMPSNVSGAFVGVGADGTVYATDNLRLYALSPEGTLLWTMAGAGGGRPITFADDGTIYTSWSGTGVRAIDPDGILQWEFIPPDIMPLLAGPNVGPDGNIYAVQDTSVGGAGLGAFSLDPDGQFRWSELGEPPIFNTAGGSNSDIVFGTDRLFAGIIGANGPPPTYAFDFEGDQVWYSGGGDLSIPATSFPRMLPDGRIAFRLAQTGLMAVWQNGDVDWQLSHPGGASNVVLPAVGPDGVIYSGNWSGVRLWAVNPNGTTRWVHAHESGNWLQALGVSPDNATIIAQGTPGWVRGYNPANGDLLWQVDLLSEEGLPQIPVTIRPAFSPNSQTAYVTTMFVGSGVGHTYLYAIRIGDEIPPIPGDLDGDGVVSTNDLLLLFSNWGPCPPPEKGECPADLDGDGLVGTTDLLELFANWG